MDGGGNVAMAAAVPFFSCLQREVYVEAVQPSYWQKKCLWLCMKE